MTDFWVYGILFFALLMLFAVPAAIVAAVVYLAVAHPRKKAERVSEQIAQDAAARGFRYEPSATVTGLRGGPFGRGWSGKSKNITWGRAGGWTVAAFQYEWDPLVTPKNHEPTVELVSAVYVGASLPYMGVWPEDDLTYRAGDLTLESVQFNEAFRVEAADMAMAVQVLDPRMMEFMNARRAGKWWLANGWLYTDTRTSMHLTASEYTAMAEKGWAFLTEVARQLPRSVVRQNDVTWGRDQHPDLAMQRIFKDIPLTTPPAPPPAPGAGS